MRIGLLAVVLLGACFSPQPPAGIACSANDACPAGLHCDPGGLCVAAGGDLPDASPPDPDGNDDAPPACANAVGHDEDGDGFDDGCDNCPHVAQTNQDNADGDDLGDACDPHPGETDTIVLFESFASTPTGWSLPLTGATVANDQLEIEALGGTSEVASFPAMAPGALVIAHVGFEEETNAVQPNAAVLTNVAGAGTFYKCGTSPEPHVELVRHLAGIPVPLDIVATPSIDWLDATLSIENQGGNLTCRIERDGDSRTATGVDTMIQADGIGLRVREGKGTFDYVLVIAH